jgi:hypothetical protein
MSGPEFAANHESLTAPRRRLRLIGLLALLLTLAAGGGCGLNEYETRLDATTRGHRTEDQQRRQQAGKAADDDKPANAPGPANGG